jgi:DNA polymerase-3 subunit chi
MSHIRVDFYLLTDNQPEAVDWVACRLLEKAYLRGHKVFVSCESQDKAERLDELLWTYKDDSFIPHNLQGEGPEPPPPVHISYGSEPRGFHDILLNMATTVPSYFSQFRRVIEIVSANDIAKEISRNHYRVYRTHQCALHTHEVTPNHPVT